jgi:hypothetical protein
LRSSAYLTLVVSLWLKAVLGLGETMAPAPAVASEHRRPGRTLDTDVPMEGAA